MESNRRWLWRLLNAASVWGCGAATNAASILEAQSISNLKDLRRVVINIDKSLLVLALRCSVKDFTTSGYIKSFITSADESYCDNKLK